MVNRMIVILSVIQKVSFVELFGMNSNAFIILNSVLHLNMD